MKYILIIGDGMADNAVPELNGRTPLQAAEKPAAAKKAAVRRSSAKSGGRTAAAETGASRFAGSRPVKKGKGSKKK